jgi:hypothetical protein
LPVGEFDPYTLDLRGHVTESRRRLFHQVVRAVKILRPVIGYGRKIILDVLPGVLRDMNIKGLPDGSLG